MYIKQIYLWAFQIHVTEVFIGKLRLGFLLELKGVKKPLKPDVSKNMTGVEGEGLGIRGQRKVRNELEGNKGRSLQYGLYSYT